MTIYDIKEQIGLNVFTVDMIKPILQTAYAQPILKISAMAKKGELMRLKRGVYVLGEAYRDRPINPVAVANMLHKPSYVSFEYALSYYGLIPERVHTITSATTCRPVEFATKLGRYSYAKIPAKAYPLGIDWKHDAKDGGYLIATPEKALCDKVAADKRITRIKPNDMAQYLESDLRIEWADLAALDARLVWRIAMAYSSPALQSLAATLKKGAKHG